MPFQNLKNLIAQTFQLQNQKNVIIIRHGQTEANKLDLIYGWLDLNLNQTGIQQAQCLNKTFSEYTTQFKGIYSSDLKRANHTAKLIVGDHSQIYQDERVRECNFGIYENTKFYDYDEKIRKDMDSFNFVAPQGESYQNVQKRGYNFFADKVKENGTYLLVAHGIFIWTITQKFQMKQLENCSVVCLQLDEESSEPSKILFIWQFPSELFSS